jgi:hypothetical protein
MESSCELGNEPSGSIKCWELPNGCTTCGLSSGTQLHRVSSVCNILGQLLDPNFRGEYADIYFRGRPTECLKPIHSIHQV